MSEAYPAAASQRLPWLNDPVPSKPRKRRSWTPPLIFLALMAVIGIGGFAVLQQPSLPDLPAPRVEQVPLPAPRPAEPSAVVEPQAPSAAERAALRPQAADPALSPAISSPAKTRPRNVVAATAAEPDKERVQRRPAPERARLAPAPAIAVRRAPPVATARRPQALWPSTQSSGAGGRLVQIGAFGSRQQAKLGWRRMQRAYPAVGQLPAVVVDSRNSRGRKFYRFQIGTTSHAHSEVLCQRMQRIRYSCAVLGLPWKAKVER